MNKKLRLIFLVVFSTILLLSGCNLTNNKTKLDTPVLRITDATLSWDKIENASGYTLFLNGIDELDLDNSVNQYTLNFSTEGIYKIKLKARGDKDNYADSDYSNIITYKYEIKQDTKLPAPVISLNKSLVLWEQVKGATEYKIYVNNEYVETTSSPYYQLNKYHDDQTYLIKVVATGSNYLDSDFSNELTYQASNSLMKISEIKKALDASRGEINVEFVGKVMGFDSNGYAHIGDETGFIYVRHICSELSLGNIVKIKGKAYIYRGSGNYPEYTRQIASSGIEVSIYDGEIPNVIEAVNLTEKDLANKDVSAPFHGNPVTITGTVECGTTRYTFYLNDDNGNHLVAIHHYSSNFNNDIVDSSKNVFLGLNNTKVTLRGVIYRLYESENIWTFQSIGLENEVQVISSRVETPVISVVDNQVVWNSNSLHKEYKIIINGSVYSTTSNLYFNLDELEDGIFKIQVQAISNNSEYEDSTYSNTLVYTKNAKLNEVNIFMVNDMHGSFVDGTTPGVERLSSLINYLTKQNGDYLKIANGDIFQGSYAASILYGLPLVDALNEMKFDAFVIGNHEFDWGLDKIRTYKDGDYSNGEADFPFLGANIYEKKTNERVSWLDPYTVVEVNGVRVGVIGIIGHNLESSIIYDNVKDYDFVYPVEIIKQYAKELRSELACDVVIVSNHGYDTDLNNEIASLSGDTRIDAILCGHTHQNEYDILSRSDGAKIVAIENRDKNQSASALNLKLDANDNYESYSFERYYPSNYELDPNMTKIIKKYQSVIDEGNRIIGNLGYYLSRQSLGNIAVSAMKQEFKADVAIMNTGGVRATIAGGNVTVSDIFEVFPFNNVVITTSMSGKAIKSLYKNNADYLYFDQDFATSLFDDNTYYKVAVIDYVYSNTRYEEFKNTTKYDTNFILRDLVIEYFANYI